MGYGDATERHIQILLIDDDETAPVVLERLMPQRERSVSLDWASTFAEGLARLRERRHDVCFLDYRLDGLESIALLEAAVAEGCDVPIIMLTGVGGNSVDDAAMKAGASDFLQKHELNARSVDRAIRHALARNAHVAQLKAGEERLQRAIGGTSDGIWDWNADSGHFWFSRRFEAMLGYCAGELDQSFERFVELVLTNERDAVRHALETHLDDGRPIEIELRMRRRDGSPRWFRVRGRSDTGTPRRPRRMAGVVEDVTAARRVRDSLMRDRERHTSVEKLATDGVWEWNLITGDATHSARWKARLGYAEHELDDRVDLWRRLVHPDDHGLFERALADHLEHDLPLSPTVRFLDKDGAITWVLIRGGVAQRRAGRPARVVGTYTEVSHIMAAATTELWRATERVRESSSGGTEVPPAPSPPRAGAPDRLPPTHARRHDHMNRHGRSETDDGQAAPPVLLVESSEVDIRLIKQILERLHPKVDLQVTRSGEEALAFLQRGPGFESAATPGLVVLDLNLPDNDGLDTLERLKLDDDFKSIPVVVLTTSTAEGDIDESYERLANSCVAKPDDPASFVEVMEGVLTFWMTTAALPRPIAEVAGRATSRRDGERKDTGGATPGRNERAGSKTASRSG